MKLPKLNRVVTIEFWSLRNELGSSGGVMYDIDTWIKRKARRVRVKNGWKWQIANLSKIAEWDWLVEQDQYCLDEQFYYGYDETIVTV